MKGISLPVNVVVALIVAGICLLVITILLVIVNPPGPDWEALYRIACSDLVINCDKTWDEVKIEYQDKIYTLHEICLNRGVNDEATCKQGCGCY